MPWWSSIKTIRQRGEDWQGAFDRLNTELTTRFASRKANIGQKASDNTQEAYHAPQTDRAAE